MFSKVITFSLLTVSLCGISLQNAYAHAGAYHAHSGDYYNCFHNSMQWLGKYRRDLNSSEKQYTAHYYCYHTLGKR